MKPLRPREWAREDGIWSRSRREAGPQRLWPQGNLPVWGSFIQQLFIQHFAVPDTVLGAGGSAGTRVPAFVQLTGLWRQQTMSEIGRQKRVFSILVSAKEKNESGTVGRWG